MRSGPAIRLAMLEVVITAAPPPARRLGSSRLDGQLESVDRRGAVTEYPAGIVGQHVDPARAGRLGELTGQSAHVIEPGEVRHESLCPGLPGHGLGLAGGSADDQHAVPLRGELPRRGRTDPVGCSGEHHGP